MQGSRACVEPTPLSYQYQLQEMDIECALIMALWIGSTVRTLLLLKPNDIDSGVECFGELECGS